jgi:hypothetical protein
MNDEIRMTNDERMTNPEIGITHETSFGGISDFVIRISFGFRHSSFVIRGFASLSS